MYTFEGFESIHPIPRTTFYRYRFYAYSDEVMSKGEQIKIETALRPHLNKNHEKIMIIHQDRLWLLAPLRTYPPLPGFRLVDEGWYEADYVEDEMVYSQYIEQSITCHTQSKIYTLIDPHTFQSDYIQEIHGKLRNHQGIFYERQYRFKVKVNGCGKALLLISYNGLLRSENNIYEWLKKGEDVNGMLVQYDWVKIGGIGRIQRVLQTTINEIGGLNYMGQPISLIDYYKERGQSYFIEHFTSEDEAACIVEATFKDKTYEFIPHALTPIITRETLAKMDPDFSKRLTPYMKQTMAGRFKVLQHFVCTLQQNNLKLPVIFETSHYVEDLEAYHLKQGCLPGVLLKGEKENKNSNRKPAFEKQRIFREGFYKQNKEPTHLVIFYPKEKYEQTFSFARVLEDFATRGIWQEKRYDPIGLKLLKNLRPLSTWQFCAYEEKLLSQMKPTIEGWIQKAQFMLVITCEAESGVYEFFKRLGAQYKTPSQMLTLSTVKQILEQNVAGYMSMKNLILGMLVKLGGIPWLAEKMPGRVSCFIGLDVALQASGVHYAACSTLFNEKGEVLAYYRPKALQPGEKINAEVLAELFDKIIHKYKVQYGHYPEHIVIHRDGFANEQIEWYEAYFKRYGITFDLIEIRKNCRMKIAEIGKLAYHNPEKGTYIRENEKAYLVTTQIDERKGLGTPSVLMIEKIYGETDFMILLEQVYILSEIHVGAFQNTRLPITTGYADSMCKAIHYIPEGKVDNKLYFI